MSNKPLKAVRCWGKPEPVSYDKSMFVVGGFRKFIHTARTIQPLSIFLIA